MYADDIVLMAEGKDKMKNMIGRLEKYRKKKLELNPSKTKIMRFRKGTEKLKEKRKWRWKGKRIEEVKEFQYLFFWYPGGNT